MTDIYSIIGIGLGLLGIFALFVAKWRYNRPMPRLAEGLVVFLTCAAIMAGVKVCLLSFDVQVVGMNDNERLYVFLGGLAVIWLSGEAIWRTFTARE